MLLTFAQLFRTTVLTPPERHTEYAVMQQLKGLHGMMFRGHMGSGEKHEALVMRNVEIQVPSGSTPAIGGIFIGFNFNNSISASPNSTFIPISGQLGPMSSIRDICVSNQLPHAIRYQYVTSTSHPAGNASLTTYGPSQTSLGQSGVQVFVSTFNTAALESSTWASPTVTGTIAMCLQTTLRLL